MSDSNMISAMVGGIITAIAAYAIFLFIIWILTVIAKWRIFTKAGLAGWKSIIPIYSDYCTYRIAWNKKAFCPLWEVTRRMHLLFCHFFP